MSGQENKKTIHPVAIFEQAWGAYWGNWSKLGITYLIFNLPITLISLTPLAKLLAEQKPGLLVALGYLVTITLSSWGQIALLLGSQQGIGIRDYSVGQNIKQAAAYLGKYLALIFCNIIVCGKHNII